MNDQQAIEDFYRVADCAERRHLLENNQQLIKAKDTADRWALKHGKQYVVVDIGSKSYQIWSRASVGKSEWVYCTGEDGM